MTQRERPQISDSCKSDIYVQGPGGRPVRPWVTLRFDLVTRLVAAASVALKPDRGPEGGTAHRRIP
jgi:hypothetical protein